MRHELDVRTVILIKANALELPTHFQSSASAENVFISQAVDYRFLFFFSSNERVCAFVFHIRHMRDVCNLIIQKSSLSLQTKDGV